MVKKIAFRATAVLLGVAVALLFIEMLPRAGLVSKSVVPVVPTQDNPVVVNDLMEFDPVLINKWRPNLRYYDSTAGGDNIFAVKQYFGMKPFPFRAYADAEGFLNPELPQPIDTITRCDIAIIGDSFMSCPRLYDETPFEVSLQKHLPNGDTLLVLNYSVISYGPQQELHVLKTYALPKHPRLVIWAFCDGNDLFDAATYQARLEAAKKQHARSFVATIVRQGLRKRDEEEIVREMEKNRASLPDGSPIWFHNFGENYDSLCDEGFPIFAQVIDEAQRLCDERGIKLFVLFIPSKWRVYRDFVTIPPRSAYSRWKINNVPQRVKDLCREKGIPLRDCLEDLQAPIRRGVQTYYPNDSHWNGAGAEIGAGVAAEEIADWLR